MTGTAPLDRVDATIAAAADGPVARQSGARPIAVGWATVELDRAAAELAVELGLPEQPFEEAAESVALGARCRVAHRVLAGGLSLVVLEPTTEGRLAASLARLGEGPAAVWFEAPTLEVAVDALAAAGVGTSVERPGPCGPERLVLHGPIHGPHRLLIEAPAGTIDP